MNSRTLLVGGLSSTHDALVAAALRGRGIAAEPVGTADQGSLAIGRKLLARGHCNPTYYLSGALVERLRRSAAPGRYAYLTIGSCGPCRFATYAAEHRRALAAAGFSEVPVVVVDQLRPTATVELGSVGVTLDGRLISDLARAAVVGDVLVRAGCWHRARTGEAVAVDRALAKALGDATSALEEGHSPTPALTMLGDTLGALGGAPEKPRLRLRLTGEFFAATTDGHGSYGLVRWLEGRGAAVEPPAVVEWLCYLAWQLRRDTERRLPLYRPDSGPRGLAGRDGPRVVRHARGAERALCALYGRYAAAVGVGWPLLDMDDLAVLAAPHYLPDLRAGMGHLEVATFLAMNRDRRADLVVSIKPFGCLPSSAVSDAVLAVLARQARHCGFVAVETTGDAEATVESRLELALDLAAKGTRSRPTTSLSGFAAN
jgi:predicted nucleotide-binding protein (sugar kinase/HSP70/actin superfamily)